MILKTVKRSFLEALEDQYPETESSSFFNLLAEDILRLKRIDVATNLYAVVSGKKHERFLNALKRLKENEPIQYVLGKTEFYGLPFKVNKNVLIPRPETEELVDWILKSTDKAESINILDIGTGSGCIAITLAKHMPNNTVYALDVSDAALKVAQENAELNAVDINFIEADVLEMDNLDVKYNIIVSNPPYVREQEKEQMQANVVDYEPHEALFVKNNDALLFYRAIAVMAKENLYEGGTLYFEINEFLGEETKSLLIESGFSNVELKKDMSGKDRLIKATRI